MLFFLNFPLSFIRLANRNLLKKNNNDVILSKKNLTNVYQSITYTAKIVFEQLTKYIVKTPVKSFSRSRVHMMMIIPSLF